MSKTVCAGFECGDESICVIGNELLVNGEWIADFSDSDYAADFVAALERYGTAVWQDGYDAASGQGQASGLPPMPR